MQHLHVEQGGRVERHAGLAEDDEALVQAICRQPPARQSAVSYGCLLVDAYTLGHRAQTSKSGKQQTG